MIIFLDESGDLGWSFDKPFQRGGSSRYITIAGIAVEEKYLKQLMVNVHRMMNRHGFQLNTEIKGSMFSDNDATVIIRQCREILSNVPFEIASITSDKQNVNDPLRRDKNVFYNHMLSSLLVDLIGRHQHIDIILDDRTIRRGSRNSLEDCLRAKCWGDLNLDAHISCRYKDSENNLGIWLADWLSNFIWRHYEHSMNEAYLECLDYGTRYYEKKLFM